MQLQARQPRRSPITRRCSNHSATMSPPTDEDTCAPTMSSAVHPASLWCFPLLTSLQPLGSTSSTTNEDAGGEQVQVQLMANAEGLQESVEYIWPAMSTRRLQRALLNSLLTCLPTCTALLLTLKLVVSHLIYDVAVQVLRTY